MRAWDLAVFVIMVEMCLGFLAELPGLYNAPTLVAHEQGGDIYQWQHSNMNTEFGTRLTIGDYLKFAMDWVLAGYNMLVTVLTAFFAISLILYRDFGLPSELCFFVQGIVYLIYTWALVQWRSGRGGQAFE